MVAACGILVRKLNQMGGNWGPPKCNEDLDDKKERNGPVDCEATDQGNAKTKLHVQFVRADPNPALWKNLNTVGHHEEANIAGAALAECLKRAIGHKTNHEDNPKALPMATRRGLVLALDATRLPVLGFDAVVREFQSRYGAWASTQGFDAIWLVGPEESLTWRLDQ